MRDGHRFIALCSSYVLKLRELHVSGIAARIVSVTDETRVAWSYWMVRAAHLHPTETGAPRDLDVRLSNFK